MVVRLHQTEFADWLARELRARHWNQSKLAAYLGIHPSGVNRWFTKAAVPNTETCQRLAEVLHVPAESVLRAAGHLPPEEPASGGLAEARLPYGLQDWVRLIPLLPSRDQEIIASLVQQMYERVES